VVIYIQVLNEFQLKTNHLGEIKFEPDHNNFLLNFIYLSANVLVFSNFMGRKIDKNFIKIT
jgi:hypothetical protein